MEEREFRPYETTLVEETDKIIFSKIREIVTELDPGNVAWLGHFYEYDGEVEIIFNILKSGGTINTVNDFLTKFDKFMCQYINDYPQQRIIAAEKIVRLIKN